MFGGRWGIYAEPIEPGRRLDAGPLDEDGVAGFGKDGGGDRDGHLMCGDEEEEEEEEYGSHRNGHFPAIDGFGFIRSRLADRRRCSS